MNLLYTVSKRHNRLSTEHCKILYEESAISPEVVAVRGYYTARKPSHIPKVFSAKQRRHRGMVIPLYGLDGETVSFQLRPDYPSKDGPKYLNPTGSHLIPDVHPSMREKLGDVREPLLITEGAKTADAVTSRGLCTILLSGVWNFAVPKTHCSELLPCFDHVPLDGRLVYVGYDSDSRTNPDVQDALGRLVARLAERGANVLVLYPPVVNGDPKTGLDDYLAAGGDLAALLLDAKPYQPVDIRRERLSKDERLRRLAGELWAVWQEMPVERQGQCTDKATMRQFIERAEEGGKIKGGRIEVSPTLRTLAQAVGISVAAQSKSLKRLEASGYITRAGARRDQKTAQTYLLGGRAFGLHKEERGRVGNETQERATQGNSYTYKESYPCVNQTRGVKDASAQVPELRNSKTVPVWARVGERWQVVDADFVFRLGKRRGEILRYLVAVGGSATVEELFSRFASGKARLRDFRRRTLADLEGFRMQQVVWVDDDLNETVRERLELGPPIVEVAGDVVRLTPEWRENLETVRIAGREQEDARLQAEKIARQRKDFHETKETPIVPDKTPAMPEAGKVREILARGRENDAAFHLKEQREKAGLPVEEFIRERLAALGAIRLELLEEIWRDRGGNPSHVYPTVLLMDCELVTRPELSGEVFVYPPPEARPGPTPEPGPPENLVPLFSGAVRAAV